MNDTERQYELYRSLITPDSVVFDIGANVGNRSAVFASMSSRVIAVEPQSRLYPILMMRMKHSTLQNVTVVKKAVGSAPGNAMLSFPKEGTLGRDGVATLSSYFKEVMGPEIFNLENGWDAEELVEVTTLDRLIQEYGVPSFIKIDVEGYECEVVEGLSQKVKALSFEFHPNLLGDLDHVILKLMKLGFHDFNYCLAEKFELQLPRWVTGLALILEIQKFGGNKEIYGDVYAR